MWDDFGDESATRCPKNQISPNPQTPTLYFDPDFPLFVTPSYAQDPKLYVITELPVNDSVWFIDNSAKIKCFL